MNAVEPVSEIETAAPEARDGQACFHCGTACRDGRWEQEEKSFCCRGCLTVFELLTSSGLTDFYKLNEAAGVRVGDATGRERFKFLDEPAVRERLVDYSDARLTRVTFHTPAIHCIACVWLLENLFRLQPGIGQSQVNFLRKEVALSFDPTWVKLSDVVALLASLGYEPELKLSALDGKPRQCVGRRLWIQLGLAGFAFGNIMLFSISSYLGLDAFAGPGFRKMVGAISLLLSLPVVTYSALDYWRAAAMSLRQRLLNIDVPIAAGIVAIFAQSTFDVLSGRGDGYFDSLCGLLFFLLCGRLFQQKTYDRLAFERDYKSFFPLSVTRKERQPPARLVGEVRELKLAGSETGAPTETQVSLAQLGVGDRLIIRNGELIPADAKLINGPALIDYSFVTGESEPVEKRDGDYIYAGGRQMGGAIEVETVKSVSQSYLTSLWNQEAFDKQSPALNVLTNTYSQRFTKLVLAVSLGAGIYWAFVNPALSLKAFTSVLIVACPCALALAAPFALGTTQRVLGRRNIFLKNPHVLESLARVDAVVFDKTGTLTAAGAGNVKWCGVSSTLTPAFSAGERGNDSLPHGSRCVNDLSKITDKSKNGRTLFPLPRGEGQGEGEGALSLNEECWLYSMTRHSTHPLPVRIGAATARDHSSIPVRSFLEVPGCGMEGSVEGHEIWMGSAGWLQSRGVAAAILPAATGSVVHVAMDGKHRGYFVLASALRPETENLVAGLSSKVEVALVSGDNEKERGRFSELFGNGTALHFNQSPLDKLNFITRRQAAGKTVMMVGDGLNDAGALKQSDVGVAVVENISAFSPASDVILAVGNVARLADLLRYAKQSVRVVRAAFLISTLYNLIGVSIAASGRLSPVVCAILMPLSSITVVAFACGAAAWFGRGLGGAPITAEGQP